MLNASGLGCAILTADTKATCMHSLAHKVALVTGVTRRQGIGAAIALALAQAGADIYTPYYRPYDRSMGGGVQDTEPEQILEALCQTGVRADGVEIDLSHTG